MSPRARNARPGHIEDDDDCMCPWCLTEDMNMFVANQLSQAVGRQLDPADYAGHTATGKVMRPESIQPMLEAEAWIAEHGDAHTIDPEQPLPVRVSDTGPGVWARFTGINPAGEVVTVAAAVVAGPTVLDDRTLAILLDLYDPARTQLTLRTDHEAVCWLVGDDEDIERQLAHTIAPVFGAGARKVFLWRWTKPRVAGRRWSWVPEELSNVSAADLRALEHDPCVRLSGVRHNPIPVPSEVL